jgi:hypothetical protein
LCCPELKVPVLKVPPGRVDGEPMHLRPLFLIRGNDHRETSTLEAAPVDFGGYSDDQLIVERDRRQRDLEELTLRRDHTSTSCARLVSLDREVDRLTDELIRRARSRHPSSRGLAG